MKAHYGYYDGSGEYFIIIDTDRCQKGCFACVAACHLKVLEVGTDLSDPVDEKLVPIIPDKQRKNIRFLCGNCRSSGHNQPPCVAACESRAIRHTFF